MTFLYKGKEFPSIREIPTILYTGNPLRLNRPKYRDINIARTTYDRDRLEFLAYRGEVLPPSMHGFIMGRRTARAIRRSLEHSGTQTPQVVVDVGTGSGIIAVTAAHFLSKHGLLGAKNAQGEPLVKLIATDISGSALKIAHLNAEINGYASYIHFRKRDMLQDLVAEFGKLEPISKPLLFC